ncbi:MAG: BrnT family toxin [Bacteroidales bacterium]|nr:BrnT family toxin [Bacteroidales bacterium]
MGLETYLLNIELDKPISKINIDELFSSIGMACLHDKYTKKTKNTYGSYYLLGSTDSQRLLFIVFTIRESLIRVISARDMSKKERKIYYEQLKKNTKI